MTDTYDEHETFDSGDSGASDTYPLAVGEIKKNHFMVMNGRPCKVVDYSTAKTGKHGHAKASITAIDIFNKKKYEDSLPASHSVDVPIIKRTEWQVLGIQEDGFLTLMDLQGKTREDLSLPDETEDDRDLAKNLRALFEAGSEKDIVVTVLSSMQIEKVVEFKEQ